MSRSLLGGGAVTAVTLLSASLIFYAKPSIAEPLASEFQQQGSQQTGAVTPEARKELVLGLMSSAAAAGYADASDDTADGKKLAAALNRLAGGPASDFSASGPAQQFVATAYSLKGRTASGRNVSRGIIAADRKVLPLGTRVRLDAGPYSGEYLVADTGGLVRGRKIDIWVPNTGEAMRFGRRSVKLTVLAYGGGRRATQPADRIRR